MVKNSNTLFKIEFYVLIVQIFLLCIYAAKKSFLYEYYFTFLYYLLFQIRQKKQKELENVLCNIFTDYCFTDITGQGILTLFVWIILFVNFIFLIIGFCIHRNKTNTNCINICIPIFLFSLNLLSSILVSYLEFFCEFSKLYLTETQLNLFKGFKEQIITNLNSLRKRKLFLEIYSVLLIICNIIHIIFTIILRKAIKNIKSPVPLLEKEDKDIEEIVKDNTENSDNFIKFDNETNGLFIMKFIKYINAKLGV